MKHVDFKPGVTERVVAGEGLQLSICLVKLLSSLLFISTLYCFLCYYIPIYHFGGIGEER